VTTICVQLSKSANLSMTTRGREQDDSGPEPSSKRTKVADVVTNEESPVVEGGVEIENPLPPSHVLLGIPPATSDGFMFRIQERDVGISEYVGRNAPKIDGIIKQRSC
jgi:tRNA pseudouridine13 synthase